MKQVEKEKLVVDLFSNKILFELDVLSVKSEKDRLEIINILVERFIRDLLKNELNFLYMQDFKRFKFSLIINLLFKEIADEWLGFSSDILHFSKEEALGEIQDKKRIAFIYALSQEYFLEYKNLFFTEISNTFLELAEVSISSQRNNQLIEYILQSTLVKDRGIVVIQNYSQLLARVKSAKNYKSEKLSILQVKIAEASISLESSESEEENKKYEELINHYKNEKRTLESLSLDNFDGALKRLKETMIVSMSQMKIV